MMQLAQQLAYLAVAGEQLLRCQHWLEAGEYFAVELGHQDEVEGNDLFGVVCQQNARYRHAQLWMDQGYNVCLLLHLPMQGIRINLENDWRIGTLKGEHVNRGNLAAMNVGDICHLLTRKHTINDRLRGGKGNFECRPDAHCGQCLKTGVG